MATIRKEITTVASPDDVWAAIRDIGALHTRLVPGFVVNTKLEPGARIVTFAMGSLFANSSSHSMISLSGWSGPPAVNGSSITTVRSRFLPSRGATPRWYGSRTFSRMRPLP